MPTLRFRELIVNWAALHDGLAPRLPELPHLAKDHTSLAALLVEVRELESRQDQALGQLRQINQRREEIRKQGRDLHNRLASGLRAAFGLESEELLKFRIQPRSRQPRRRIPSKAEKAAQLAQLAAVAAARAEVEEAVRTALEAKARLNKPEVAAGPAAPPDAP